MYFVCQNSQGLIMDNVANQYFCVQCDRDFVPKRSGFIRQKDGPFDPFSVHLFHPPAFLGFWAVLRESLLADGLLNRKNKEILGVFVSKANKCNFCANTHMLAAQSQGAGRSISFKFHLATCALSKKQLHEPRLFAYFKCR